MPDKTPPEKPQGWVKPQGRPLTEMEKYWAGEDYDKGKLFQEMDNSFWDSVFDGLKE